MEGLENHGWSKVETDCSYSGAQGTCTSCAGMGQIAERRTATRWSNHLDAQCSNGATTLGSIQRGGVDLGGWELWVRRKVQAHTKVLGAPETQQTM